MYCIHLYILYICISININIFPRVRTNIDLGQCKTFKLWQLVEYFSKITLNTEPFSNAYKE